jgi:glycosyltransferase involved in cell wall biosynthesis
MKILVISNCELNPNQGSGYVICGFTAGLRDRGHNLVVLGPEHFLPAPSFSRAKRLRLLVGYTWATISRTVRLKPDLIELWGGPGWLACWFLTKWPGRKFLVISRSNGIEPNKDFVMSQGSFSDLADSAKNLRPTLVEQGFRCADGLVLVSKFDADFALARKYQPTDRILTIENPLPAGWEKPKSSAPKERIIGFVGSWIDRKGADILPGVMRTVLEHSESAKFLLIGVGEKAAGSLASEFGSDRLEIVPQCDRDELKNHYGRMSLLVVPSMYESFGLVIAEAMACGVPVAATPVGFAAALKDQENFFCIKQRSVVPVADLILAILNNEPARQKIACAGQARVRSLEWPLALTTLEKWYLQLRDERGGAGQS